MRGKERNYESVFSDGLKIFKEWKIVGFLKGYTREYIKTVQWVDYEKNRLIQ